MTKNNICEVGPSCPYFKDLCCKVCPQRHWCYAACEKCPEVYETLYIEQES